MWGHVTHFLNFGTPYISELLEGRNFKFGTEIGRKELYGKYANLGQKES